MAAIQYIETHLSSETMDLDAIAAAVHYSKYHIHRLFTDTVGLTIHEYAQRRQLTEAAKMLVFSNKPILDIAILAGYDSQQAFSSVFKAMYKRSPRQFRKGEVFYPLQLEFNFKNQFHMLEGVHDPAGRVVRLAAEDDIPHWMDLVRLAVDGFPCLNEGEHLTELKRHIADGGALVITQGTALIGAMLFSFDTGSVDFLAVNPLYRKQGITRLMLNAAFTELISGNEISITTFREGDKADTGYRDSIKQLGFAEAELLTEFGYPTQRMVLRKEDAND